MKDAVSKRIALKKEAVLEEAKKSLRFPNGVHGHWAYNRDKTQPKFTERDGYHEHLFLINGILIETEWGGEHRHPINADLTLEQQTAPHTHEIFINGQYVVVEGPGDHSHPQGELDDDGDLKLPQDINGSKGGEHKHSVTVDGKTYESITSTDVLTIETRKNLKFDVQSVRFDKGRFREFEGAARWAEDHEFNLSEREELTDQFVFHQIPRHQFKEMSLQTIRLSEGVNAIIGIRDEDAPNLPNHGTMEVHDTSVSTGQFVEQEESAFEELQGELTNGYDILTEEEAGSFADLRDDLAAQMVALRHAVSTVFPVVMGFVEKLLEQASDDAKASMLDRVGTNLSLLDETLSKMALPELEVEFAKDLLSEITKGDEAGVQLAISVMTDCMVPVGTAFEDTSFERFSNLLKSSAMSFIRFKNEHLCIKALKPSKDMTRDELRASQQDRSDKFGIEIVSGSALTFPANFPTELKEYGDPVNLKFPFETEARARNARVRFKQFATQIYSEESSMKIVHERIVRRELDFGIEVAVNPDDPLDALLPSSILERDDVVVQTADISKMIFIPILKEANEERIAFGVVLEPDVTDLHGDTYDEKEVVDAAHSFMQDFQNMGLQHEMFVNEKVKVLESFLAPVDMTIETPKGPVTIRKNTWLMKVRILDETIWNQVKTGELTGFSIGALANVEAIGAAAE